MIIIVRYGMLQSNTIFAPLNDPVYSFLERMEVKQLSDLSLSVKPISRGKIALELQKIQENKHRLSRIDQKKLYGFIEEYAQEIHQIEQKKQSPILQNFFHFFAEDSLENFSKKQQWNPFVLPYEFQYEKNYFRLIPLARYSFTEISADCSLLNKNRNRLTGGGELHAYIGNNIGIFFRGVNNAEWGSRYDFLRIHSTEQGIGALISDDTFYEEVEAYLSYSGKHTNIILGRFSNIWGGGITGSPILSNRAPAYPQIMMRADLASWANFTYFHGWLESNTRDDSLSYTFDGGHGYTHHRNFYKKKYIAAHRLGLSFAKNFHFGISELLYYGERDPEFVYFVPVMLFWSAQHNTNDQDNLAIAFDFDWYVYSFAKIYGSILIDEIRLRSVFDSKNSHNQFGMQIGFFFPECLGDKLDLRLEYTRINPWVYEHKFPINTAYSDDYVMGYWTGQNADNFYCSATYRFSAQCTGSIFGEYYRKGAQDSSYYQYSDPAEQFLYGKLFSRVKMGLSLTYSINHYFWCKLSGEHENIDVNEKNVARALSGEYVDTIYLKKDCSRSQISFSLGIGFYE